MLERNQYLQNSILKLMIEDEDFIKRAALYVEPVIFTHKLTQKLSKIVLDYYSSYEKPPGFDSIDTLTLNGNFRGDEKEELDLYLDRLEDINANKKFVLDQLDVFVRRRKLEEALNRSMALLEKDKFDLIEEELREALAVNVSGHCFGIDYLDIEKLRDGREIFIEDGFYFGIPGIDKCLVAPKGVQKGKFIFFEGDKKGRKTWALLYVAVQCVMQKFNALYLSAEMGEDEITTRLDMSVTGLAEGELKLDDKVKGRLALTRFGGKLKYRCFPMGDLYVEDIEKLIQNLELLENWSPDDVIVDYGAILKTREKFGEERHRHNKIFETLKRLAQVRNIRVWTASQVNTPSLDRAIKTKKSVDEDNRKIGTADMIIGLGQEGDMKAKKELCITMVASRFCKDGFWFYVREDIDRGQFYLGEIERGGEKKDGM